MSDPMFACDECHGSGVPDSKAVRRVDMHDAIQILGEHIYNPVTGAIVPNLWQLFAVTQSQQGLWLDRASLIPIRAGNPIRMIAICAVNGCSIDRLHEDHPFWCGNPKPIW